MRNINLSDTIAAISTPIGKGGIGIVRLSGKDALRIADEIFVSKNEQRPSGYKTYTVNYGWIVESRKSQVASRKSNAIDEVLLTIMRGPKSYTKEDIVEINCHSGILVLKKILDLVLSRGARLAEPGEFTKRAFIHGRIDLSKAEAVLDIINAKTDSALKLGIEQLRGNLSQEINSSRRRLLDMLTLLEADIDFPDEELGAVDFRDLSSRLFAVNNDLKRILDSSNRGRIFREGIIAVICGRPNVGKSSLLNGLLKQERSLVTPIAGTTRDTIEEAIDIKGIPVRITDTAGIIEPRDLIEKKAVERSRKHIEGADLAILVFDNNKRLDREDEILMQKLAKKKTIAVINKIDLKSNIDKDKIRKRFNRIVEISAKKMMNIELLEEQIADLVYKGEIRDCEAVIVSNLRHIEAISKAQKLIANTLNSLDNKLSLEFIAQDIKEALGFLDDIVGKRFSEDLLDKIFSEFCIGK